MKVILKHWKDIPGNQTIEPQDRYMFDGETVREMKDDVIDHNSFCNLDIRELDDGFMVYENEYIVYNEFEDIKELFEFDEL